MWYAVFNVIFNSKMEAPQAKRERRENSIYLIT